MEKLNDKWLRLIGIPAVELLTNLLYLEQYQYDWWVYLRTSFWGMFYVFALWEIFTRWLRWVRTRYSLIDQTRQRILTTFLGYFFIVTIAQLGVVALFDRLGIAGIPITSEVYIQQLLGGYVVVMLVGIAYEIIYYLSKLKSALIEAESAKKTGLQHQYDTLKAQINPHFLFNSLNSLSTLIEENPQQASIFLDELSSVYRYLLQTNERGLVTLRQELDFIGSFYHLLQIRYGTAIALQIKVNQTYLEFMLPPLTLQVLVENAVSHNVLLPETPLKINIQTNQEGQLVVENTISRKTLKVVSDRAGLASVVTQYRLQGLPDPVILDNERLFTVTLPLAPNGRSNLMPFSQKQLVL